MDLTRLINFSSFSRFWSTWKCFEKFNLIAEWQISYFMKPVKVKLITSLLFNFKFIVVEYFNCGGGVCIKALKTHDQVWFNTESLIWQICWRVCVRSGCIIIELWTKLPCVLLWGINPYHKKTTSKCSHQLSGKACDCVQTNVVIVHHTCVLLPSFLGKWWLIMQFTETHFIIFV